MELLPLRESRVACAAFSLSGCCLIRRYKTVPYNGEKVESIWNGFQEGENVRYVLIINGESPAVRLFGVKVPIAGDTHFKVGVTFSVVEIGVSWTATL
jgi:hypothetical protein